MSALIDIITSYSTADFLQDLTLVGIAYGYILLTILIPVYLEHKGVMSKFVARKTIHLFTGLVVLIVPFFILPLYAVIIALSLTIAVYFSGRDSSVKQLQELYEAIGEEAEEKAGRLQGPFYYSLSITLLFTIFVLFAPYRLYFPICGILIMIISDSLASVVGKNYGRIKIALAYTGSERTLEGSLTFFASAFLLCYGAFYYYGLFNPINQKLLTLDLVLIYALVTALAGTLFELFSPSTTDDLTVPVATTLVIFLLALL